MWTAAAQASGEWLLFTDADVIYRPDVLTRALNYAEAESADHVVLFPRMIMHSPGERIMIAFFQTLFVFGHRPWKVADPKTKDHMGVGAFNLVRRRVYEAVGTYEALRPDNPRIFAHVRTYEDDIVLCVHNLARSAQAVQLDLSRWEGFVPEEMLGRTRFPAIGELPYLLTLAPRGFFWFQLRRDEG